MSSLCPFCHMIVHSSELQRHANGHFMEDDLFRDMELAHEIAFSPPSPISMQKSIDSSTSSETMKEYASISSGFTSNCDSIHCKEKIYQDKISFQINLQMRSTFYRIEGGLISLLKSCLEKERDNSVNIISGYIDHFESIVSEDSGWGCGWRNIQMLCSHLLTQRQEAREVLFGGSGFVPDILSLQRWLEIAWEMGFDIPSSEFFGHKIYGSKKWIGTTECATLLRFFGLLARIVDFNCKSSDSSTSKLTKGRLKGRKNVKCVYGPMDKFLSRCADNLHFDALSEKKLDNVCSCSNSKNENRNSLAGRTDTNCHHALVDWVWKYFSSEFGRLPNSHSVLVANKTPLYFQHDGHSRTIIGIQMRRTTYGILDGCTLLILDPSQRTIALERSLKENTGWQKLIKRGFHTFKKPQYQILYVDPGVVYGEERDRLKKIDAELVKIED